MVAKSRSWNQTLTNVVTYDGSQVLFGSPSTIHGSFTPTGAESWRYFTKSRTWNTTPGWKALLRSQGYLQTQNMGEALATMEQPYSVGLFKLFLSVSNWITYWGPVIVSAPSSYTQVGGSLYSNMDSILESDAKSKALAQARDMKTNVAEVLGDGRKTVRMLNDTVKRLGKAYSLFRRRRFRAAAKELGIGKPKGAANHWLEYAYGWSPLLSDARALAELAAQHLGVGGRPPRFTAKGNSSFHRTGVISDPNSSTTGNYCYLKGYYWAYDYNAIGRAGLLCEIEYSSAQLAAQVGYGLTDPALLAWELTPFSFVFDWFIDVGTWLENIGSLQGLKVLTGFYSITKSSKGLAWGGNKDGQGCTLQGMSPRVPFNFRQYNRFLWTGTTPSIRMPLIDGLNARRMVTSAALWRQRTRGDRLPGGYHP